MPALHPEEILYSHNNCQYISTYSTYRANLAQYPQAGATGPVLVTVGNERLECRDNDGESKPIYCSPEWQLSEMPIHIDCSSWDGPQHSPYWKECRAIIVEWKNTYKK